MDVWAVDRGQLRYYARLLVVAGTCSVERPRKITGDSSIQTEFRDNQCLEHPPESKGGDPVAGASLKISLKLEPRLERQEDRGEYERIQQTIETLIRLGRACGCQSSAAASSVSDAAAEEVLACIAKVTWVYFCLRLNASGGKIRLELTRRGHRYRAETTRLHSLLAFSCAPTRLVALLSRLRTSRRGPSNVVSDLKLRLQHMVPILDGP